MIKKKGQYQIYISRIKYSNVINDSHSTILTFNMGEKSKDIIYADSPHRTVPYRTVPYLNKAAIMPPDFVAAPAFGVDAPNDSGPMLLISRER